MTLLSPVAYVQNFAWARIDNYDFPGRLFRTCVSMKRTIIFQRLA